MMAKSFEDLMKKTMSKTARRKARKRADEILAEVVLPTPHTRAARLDRKQRRLADRP